MHFIVRSDLAARHQLTHDPTLPHPTTHHRPFPPAF